MTKEEYQAGLKKLNDEYRKAEAEYLKAKKELSVEYVLSNSIYQVGDIVIESSNKIMRITDISVKYSTLRKEYLCVYTGIILNKDLTPKMPEKHISATYIKAKLNP